VVRRVLGVAAALGAALVFGGCYGQTEPAADVSSTTATLNAHGLTDNNSAQAFFQYARAKNALGTGFGLQTPTLTFGPNLSGPFAASVSGLLPATNYFFRVCGNDVGQQPVCNSDLEFTTTMPGAAAAFAPPLSTVGSRVLATGDFNGDGIPDIVAQDAAQPSTVHVLLGNGDGTFSDAGTVDLRTPAGSPLTVADVNRDGRQDLVALSLTTSNVEVFPGRGDGTFGPPILTPISTAPHLPAGIAVADFNRDGRPDIVLFHPTQSGSSASVAQVMIGNGNGGFQPTSQTFFAEQGGQALWNGLVVGDFNHDGKLDLALSKDSCSISQSHCGVSVFLGNGNGTFGAEQVYDPGANPSLLVAGGLHGNGVVDLITRTLGGLTVLNGKGDGTFGVGATYATPDDPIQVADVNGDGKPDLVASVFSAHGGVVFTATDIWLGNGDGTLQSPIDVSSCLPDVIADFNGDGKPDVGCEQFKPGSSGVIFNATPPPA
jgi:hypothetical protein